MTYAGPQGQMVVDELAGTSYLTVRMEEHRAMPTTRYGMPSVDSIARSGPIEGIGLWTDVLRPLLANGDYPTGEQGRQAVRTLIAAYVSDEMGHRPVKVDGPDLPADRVFPWA